MGVMTSRKEIGKRIRVIREKLGLKQSEFAAILNVASGASISGYEMGDNWPTAETLIRIVEIGNVTYDWLFMGYELPQGLTADDIRLIAEINSMDKERKRIVRELINLLVG